MQISVTQTDDLANYLIGASGSLRIILLYEDMALFQFHLRALAGSKKEVICISGGW